MTTQTRRIRQATECLWVFVPNLDIVPVVAGTNAIVAAVWWLIAHITHTGPPPWWIPVATLAAEAIAIAVSSDEVDTLGNVVQVMLTGIVFLIAWESREVVHTGWMPWWIPPTGVVAIEALLWAAPAVFWRPPAAPPQLVGPCTGCGQTVHGEHAPGRYRSDTSGYLCPARMHLHDRRHQLAQPTPAGERLHPAGRQ